MKCLIRTFKNLNIYVDQFSREKLQEYEIDVLPQHIPIIHVIYDSDNKITFNELQKQVNLSKSTLSDALKRYSNLGLIIKHEKCLDKRQIYIQLTDLGIATHDKIEQIDHEFEQLVFKNISDDEQVCAESLLEKILNNLMLE